MEKEKKKIGSIIFNVFIIIAAILGMALSLHNEKPKHGFSKPICDIVAQNIPEESTWYHYKQLDEKEQIIYLEMLKNIAEGRSVFYLDNFTVEDFEKSDEAFLEKIFLAMRGDHKELFWCKSVAKPVVEKQSVRIAVVEEKFWQYKIFKGEMVENYFTEVNNIVSMASEFDSDFEKALFVHDYLIGKMTYDHAAAEDIDDNDWSIESSYAYSSFGGLLRGKGVCAGYAGAFSVAMQRLGIECCYVSGDAEGVSHAWNLAKLDGEYYYFDITWDDVENISSEEKWHDSDGCYYNYFAITTEELLKEHTPEDFEYPYCDAVYNNYFHNKKYYVDRNSVGRIYEIFEEQASLGYKDIEIKFSDTELLDDNRNNLYEAANDICSKYGYDYEICLWQIDDDMNVVSFYLKEE